MGNESAIVFSGIAPHPPIMVPEVGGQASAEVSSSIKAMAELTRRLIASRAETVVLISPHAPLVARAYVAYHSPQLSGDFASFRAPQTQVEFQLDEDLLAAIARAATEQDAAVINLENRPLDHGSAVPLYFLMRNGWSGRVVVLGYSFLSNEAHLKFGACIRSAVDAIGRRVAFIASGDLSHRLKLEAPAGYNPGAQRFDDEVVAALQDNSPEQIINIDQELRQLAGECGYRSMLVALGAVRELPLACEVLNYEAPFGVGYLVAQLTNATVAARATVAAKQEELTGSSVSSRAPDPPADFDLALELPALARLAIETYVQTGKQIAASARPSALLSVRAACFVSIKTHAGELRGCIGTIEPLKPNLVEELIANAINAATRDPRFSPISTAELPDLRYSVDVLAAPEPATMAELDPKIYGVIVEDESGTRRGLLLPDIVGVDTAEQQVSIAAQKAGIVPETAAAAMKLSRFRVDRYREKK
jgi:AmmeMemoRadiSam system protein A/AmmeMemoRadiSam system protein B